MTLAEYLRREASRPYRIGEADCVTLVADWVRLRCGVDPMEHCRGYTDKQLLQRWGSLARAMGEGLRGAGLRMTREPAPGDVAVALLNGALVGAIRGPQRWAMRLYCGMALLPIDRVRVIAAWRVSAA